MNRCARTLLASLMLVTGLGSSATAAAATPDFTGKWAAVNPVRELRQIDGAALPLLPEASARRAESQASAARGKYDYDPVSRCIPPGLPRIHANGAPFLILQRPKQLLVVYQFQRLMRQVYMHGNEPRDPDPAFLGNSSAHWEGDSLVIETSGFKADGYLDEVGTPFGTALRETENWRLRDADTLEVLVTLNDPEHYAAPWQSRYVFRRLPGLEIAEDVCADRTWPERIRQQENMERQP
jgi:hypothetical protein